MARLGYLFAVVLSSLALLAACETTIRITPTSVTAPTTTPPALSTSSPVAAMLTATPAPPGVTNSQHITIEGTDRLTFVPDTITVKSGQPVELTLVNHGQRDHTFTIPDLNIEVQMPAGKTNTFTFTAPQAGVYRFNSGVITEFDTMKGELIVK